MKRASTTSFLQKPVGYIVSAALIYGVAWLLFLQALDSGSLLQWAGVLLATVLATVRLGQSVNMSLRKFLRKQ